MTGAVFVDLFATYNTVNHCILMTKIYQMTDDKAMTTLLGTLLKNTEVLNRLRTQQASLLACSSRYPLRAKRQAGKL